MVKETSQEIVNFYHEYERTLNVKRNDNLRDFQRDLTLLHVLIGFSLEDLKKVAATKLDLMNGTAKDEAERKGTQTLKRFVKL